MAGRPQPAGDPLGPAVFRPRPAPAGTILRHGLNECPLLSVPHRRHPVRPAADSTRPPAGRGSFQASVPGSNLPAKRFPAGGLAPGPVHRSDTS
ncbi:protein of unknown function [Magnetospirillum sp. XM-1]|nr:protein of unknown function [Magnetospirillum sp. XM-1]